ncbi:efflux RND transporter periplasmic adaptor subunit [Clostridia bacterium]|nr:efflux RND transporter periplasmic adaptor subunit [Clostridia bacterium]
MSEQKKKTKFGWKKPFAWFKGLKKSRKILVLLLLVLIAFGFMRWQKSDEQEVPMIDEFPMSYQEVPVERGEVKRTIYVTGHATADQEQIVTGVPDEKVLRVNFKEGDSVKKGDIIYELDDTEARMNYQLQLLQYEKMVSENGSQNTGSNQIVIGASGELKELNIDRGTEVTPDTVVALIENKDYLEVRNALSINDYALFNEGDAVQVYFPQFMSFLEGKISKIDSADTPIGGGGRVRYVTIVFENPGGLDDGQKAIIQTEKDGRTIVAMGSGLTRFVEAIEVKAGVRGTISSVKVSVGDIVSPQTVLAEVDASSAKIGALEQKMELQKAKLALGEAKDLLDQYVVRAEFDGTLIELNATQGETLSAVEDAAVIASVGQLKMKVVIDEYDIGQVYVGQKADVYFTAFGNEAFSGEVSKVGQRGEVENGSVNFRAEIQIEGNDRIKPGMSGDADIFVEKKEDVLRVPREAITIMDEGLGIVQQLNAEGEPEPLEVTTGAEGDTYVEILSGLSEGDLVVLLNGNGGQNFASMNMMY